MAELAWADHRGCHRPVAPASPQHHPPRSPWPLTAPRRHQEMQSLAVCCLAALSASVWDSASGH
eukprot:20221-Eustigmatos_ZCMA.PRE.1